MQLNGKKNKNSIAQLKDTLCVYQYRVSVLDQKHLQTRLPASSLTIWISPVHILSRGRELSERDHIVSMTARWIERAITKLQLNELRYEIRLNIDQVCVCPVAVDVWLSVFWDGGMCLGWLIGTYIMGYYDISRDIIIYHGIL